MEVVKDSEVTVVLHWQDGKLLPTLWEASGKPLAPVRLCGKTDKDGAQNVEEEKMANFSLEENICSLVPSVPAMSPTVWRGLGSRLLRQNRCRVGTEGASDELAPVVTGLTTEPHAQG